MKAVQGIIQFLPPKPAEYPEGSGKFNVGIKINNAFYNQYDLKEKLEKLLTRIKIGYEIKIEVEGNKITTLQVISDKVESTNKPGSLADKMEKVNYKSLTAEAHKLGPYSMSVKFVPELSNVEKKTACFKATVKFRKEMNDGEEYIIQTFEDFGDACGLDPKEGGNIDQPKIRNAWIRMASTRAQVRALKQLTNNMEVAEEELQSGTTE